MKKRKTVSDLIDKITNDVFGKFRDPSGYVHILKAVSCHHSLLARYVRAYAEEVEQNWLKHQKIRKHEIIDGPIFTPEELLEAMGKLMYFSEDAFAPAPFLLLWPERIQIAEDFMASLPRAKVPPRSILVHEFMEAGEKIRKFFK